MGRFMILAAALSALVLGCGGAKEDVRTLSVDTSHGVLLAERPAAILGGFGASAGQFRAMGPVAVDDGGHVLVADNTMKRIEVICPDQGPLESMYYSADRENALLPETIGYVNALEFRDGALYVGSRYVVWKVTDGGAEMVTLEGYEGRMRDIAVGPDGDIFVAGDGKVRRFGPDGAAKGELEYDQEGSPWTRSVDVGADGTIYVGGRKWNCVLVYAPDGTFQRRVGEAGSGPGKFPGDVEALAVDDYGNLFVYDEDENAIEAFSREGIPVGQIGSTGSAIDEFLFVSDVHVDPEKDRLLVADAGNYVVKVYDLTGEDTDATDLVTISDPLAPTATPDHVVVSLGEDGGTTRRVAWRTAEGATPSMAQIIKTDADVADVDWTSDEVVRIWAESELFHSNLGAYRAHEVIFDDLTPGARYVYRVGSEVPEGWSSPFETVVTDPERETIRIAVVGDTRTRMDVWRQVIRATADEEPDFIVHTGDIISNGRDQDDWNRWFDEAKDVLPFTPFMPIMGNHERYAKNYFVSYSLPENGPVDALPEEAYSFDYGPTHWVGLHTCANMEEQTAWLREHMAGVDKKWIFTFYHRPAYSAHPSRGDGNMDVREAWAPIFSEHNVAIAWQGHDHYYSRSKPISDGEIVSADEGVVYIVSGGGGAPLYDFEPNEWIAAGRKIEQYVLIEITGDTLHGKAITPDGEVFDEFTMTR